MALSREISRKLIAKHNTTTACGSAIFARNLFGFFKKEPREPKDGDEPDGSKPSQLFWGDRTIYEKQFAQNFFWRPRKGIDFNVIRFIQQPINLHPKVIRRWLERKVDNYRIEEQQFLPQRRALLGTDIAAAYMMLNIGGSARFENHNVWIKKDKGGDNPLPTSYIPKMHLDGLKLDKTEILYEGLENFDGCRKLKYLSLRECEFIDDWCLDKIASADYRHTLEHLDLSKCKNVTDRGLAVLHRFRSLKKLVLEDMSHVKHLELTCLCLEEALPGLEVVGVEFKLDTDEANLSSDSEDFQHLNRSDSAMQSTVK